MVSSREEIFGRLMIIVNKIDTVAPKNLLRKINYSNDTELVGDLGLTGDDATHFMDAFAEEFGIKSGDYRASNYFDDEGLWLLSFRKPQPKQPLTLGMLVVAARQGVWDTAALEKAFAEKRYE
jgi:hypothetical protein